MLTAAALVTLIALPGCDDPAPAQMRESPLAVIERLGGRAKFSDELPGRPIVEVDLGGAAADDATMASLGQCSELRWLLLSDTHVGDAGAQRLVPLQELEVLSLTGTPTSDAALVYIARLPKLRMLFLGNTRVTDAGLKHLAALHELEDLELSGLPITDRGVSTLVGLNKLRMLHLEGTQVTEQGMNTLKVSLPTCLVLR